MSILTEKPPNKILKGQNLKNYKIYELEKGNNFRGADLDFDVRNRFYFYWF